MVAHQWIRLVKFKRHENYKKTIKPLFIWYGTSDDAPDDHDLL